MSSDVPNLTDVPEYLAIGDLGVDSVAFADHLPQADEKLWVEPAGDFPGGMMGNSAVAVSTLGRSAGVVALVGSDARGQLAMEGLSARGVDRRFVRMVDAPTFWTLSLTVSSGERTLIQFPTPAFGGDWEGFDMTLLSRVRWVHTIAEEGDPVGPLLKAARAAGATTSLDIEFPFVTDNSFPSLLSDLDVAFMNAAAAEALGGPEVAARYMQGHGVATVLVTLGREGALLCEGSQVPQVLPAWRVEAVDTNGAGDALAGAFAAGMLKGFSPREAGELAVFYAGYSTTALGGFGPALSVPELRELARVGGCSWWEAL